MGKLMSGVTASRGSIDLLAEDFNRAGVTARLSLDPNREIAEALRDESCVEGADNVFICEALYLTGTSPWVNVGKVNVGKILDTLRLLTITNRDLELASTTGIQRAGYEFYVHARAHANCRRCRGKVAAAMQGIAPDEHITYFCPTCQPGDHPPVLAHAARRPASKERR